MSESSEFQERVARIEGLVRKLESSADPSLRTTARDLLQCLMELHAEGLGRIMECVADDGETGMRLLQKMSQDSLVGSLMVLYNLHPETFEARAQRGLDKARMALRKQGATLNVLTAAQDRVHVRINGGAGEDLQAVVREALYETIPDAIEIVIEGGEKAQAAGFVPLEALLSTCEKSSLVGADLLP